MKSAEESILDPYHLTRSYRDAGELAGCSHHTVRHYVEKREAADRLEQVAARPQLIDAYLPKLEELVERSKGKIRADVVHEKLTALGYAGSERTTRRAVAEMKKAYRAGRCGCTGPGSPSPGWKACNRSIRGLLTHLSEDESGRAALI